MNGETASRPHIGRAAGLNLSSLLAVLARGCDVLCSSTLVICRTEYVSDLNTDANRNKI